MVRTASGQLLSPSVQTYLTRGLGGVGALRVQGAESHPSGVLQKVVTVLDSPEMEFAQSGRRVAESPVEVQQRR